MFTRASVLAVALQAAFTNARVWQTEQGIFDSHTQIEDYLNGNGTESTTLQSVEGDMNLLALGKAQISNRCDYPLWVWSVDQMGSKAYKIPARSKVTEPFRTPCNGCGVSIKVSKTDRLEAGKHTQFEYAIKDNILYYDISYVDCARGKDASNCPGHEKGHAIDSPEGGCDRVRCKGGSYCPTQAYYVDKPLEKLGIPEPVYGCGNKGAGMEVYFRTCHDNTLTKKSIAGRGIEMEVANEEFEE